MEYTNTDVDRGVNKTLLNAARELYKLTCLAEVKRIHDVENKSASDFSYITTYFQQAKKHLT